MAVPVSQPSQDTHTHTLPTVIILHINVTFSFLFSCSVLLIWLPHNKCCLDENRNSFILFIYNINLKTNPVQSNSINFFPLRAQTWYKPNPYTHFFMFLGETETRRAFIFYKNHFFLFWINITFSPGCLWDAKRQQENCWTGPDGWLDLVWEKWISGACQSQC